VAQDYDVVLKLLFRSQSSQAVREIAGSPVCGNLSGLGPASAVLMRLKNRRKAMRRILTTIITLNAKAREEALGQLMVICGLRGIETEVEEEIRKVPVLNSLLDHKVLGREFKKGMEQGLERGLEKGLERGLKRGRLEGEAILLHRILQHRFKKLPKWVADKLATATPAQIEKWGERLLEAESLRAVFGGD
jgi:hypothetical protein